MIDKLIPEDDEMECTFDDEGNPQIGPFSNALSMWHACQPVHPVSIVSAAMAFNATPEVIRAACEHNPWLFVVGDSIEADGL